MGRTWELWGDDHPFPEVAYLRNRKGQLVYARSNDGGAFRR